MDVTKLAEQLAEAGVQAGMDKAARILDDYIAAQPDNADRDVLDDALCVLIQAGATDPRLS